MLIVQFTTIFAKDSLTWVLGGIDVYFVYEYIILLLQIRKELWSIYAQNLKIAMKIFVEPVCIHSGVWICEGTNQTSRNLETQ